MDKLEVDTLQILRGFFLLATLAALSVNAVPALRQRFLLYGSRQAGSAAASSKSGVNKKNDILSVLDLAAKLQVPHTWFIHFYITSVASSIFWGHQIVTHGAVLNYAAKSVQKYGVADSGMTFNQIVITWVFMTLQGCRRLYECFTLTKPSKAQMPIVSWLLGIAFYTAVGMSVWIEGTPTLIASKPNLDSVEISKPSIKTWIAVPLFIYASGVQHDCHEHLANLKKYTLPSHEFFKWLLCPHYTAECVIYLAISIVSAPTGRAVNTTMALALLFTFANLALTAQSSKEWYTAKFGIEKIKGRWRMIPLVF